MRHYRCTFPALYGANTLGHKDPSARQGHYIDAESPDAARNGIRERLKQEGDPRASQTEIEVQPWN